MARAGIASLFSWSSLGSGIEFRAAHGELDAGRCIDKAHLKLQLTATRVKVSGRAFLRDKARVNFFAGEPGAIL